MLNRFYKTIHNKYSRFFRFIFFLRYLLLIFFISLGLFLIIPNFFNYEKRVSTIKNYIFKNYNYDIKKFEKISFHSFPTPRLELSNVLINFKNSSIKSSIQNLIIYPKLVSIYNFKNFEIRKLYLKENNIISNSSDLRLLVNYLLGKNNKLHFDNLNIDIVEENKTIFKLKNVQFVNFGYNKNLITGKIFDKKFKAEIKDNYEILKFKLLKSGINIDINLDQIIKINSIKGDLKAKILSNNLKFDFEYGNNSLNIFNSYFRNKELTFSNNSLIIFNPFLEINSYFEVDKIDFKKFKKFDLDKLLKNKDIIKKINSKNEINFTSKKFRKNLIDDINLKIDLAYGTMNYEKKLSILDSLFQCSGDINFLEEYPILYFDCSVVSDNKEKLFKKFSIKSKDKNKILNIFAKGNLNIFNKKLNLKYLSMNNNYQASKEDLAYFKMTFENILFDESFFDIFNLKKIKAFILEVS